MSDHPCPVSGCNAATRRGHLMCLTHWRQVPRRLQDEVWRTWRGEGVVLDDYRAARDAAIAAVPPAGSGRSAV